MSNIKKIIACLLAVMLCTTLVNYSTLKVMAMQEIKMNIDGFSIIFYDDDGQGHGSLWIMGYSGTDTEVTLPTIINYNGKTYSGSGCVAADAFKNNSTVKKIIVPDGYDCIQENAFYGCSSLEEVIVGDSNIKDYGVYIDSNAFANCPKLKTYRFGMNAVEIYDSNLDLGIGKDANDMIYPGVTAYVKKGSEMDSYLQKKNNQSNGNKITIVYQDNPASAAKVEYTIPNNNKNKDSGKDSNDDTSGGKKTKFSPGQPYSDADKAITAYKSEADLDGSVFNILQLKVKKATKKSIKIGWKKANKAVKYVVYGNACGKKNKYVKLATVKGTSKQFKKIKKAKLKKAKYYKFILVAIDKDNKIISTSKTVHIATKGGKVDSAKKVKVKSGTKVKIKVGKTSKISAKEVAPAKKKIKVHRKLSFESTNEKVATVDKKGNIKGVAAGSCEVYVYSQCGISAKINVTIQK